MNFLTDDTYRNDRFEHRNDGLQTKFSDMDQWSIDNGISIEPPF